MMQFCRRAASRVWRNQFSSVRPKTNIALISTLRRPLKHSEIFVGGALLLSAGWFGKSGDRSAEGNQDVVTMADALYKQNRFREVYEILREHKDTDDVEILWRLSRVEYNISQEQKTPADEKKRLVLEAYELIEKALKLNGSHFATHKWMSILLDAKCGYDGLKARISNLETVKKHMMIASELNKKDATILYMIGLWCYQIADMPWYQRKIASTVFAKPPDSTYEEALEYFVRAEEVEPRFYSQNLLMLGKTYLKLKEEDKARYYLDLASNYPASTDDDQIARKEAHDLLKTLKPQKAESVAV